MTLEGVARLEKRDSGGKGGWSLKCKKVKCSEMKRAETRTLEGGRRQVLKGSATRRHFFFYIHPRAMQLELFMELFTLILSI